MTRALLVVLAACAAPSPPAEPARASPEPARPAAAPEAPRAPAAPDAAPARYRGVIRIAWSASGAYVVTHELVYRGPSPQYELVDGQVCRTRAASLAQRECVKLVGLQSWALIDRDARRIAVTAAPGTARTLAILDLVDGREVAHRDGDHDDVALGPAGDLLVTQTTDWRTVLHVASAVDLAVKRTLPVGRYLQHPWITYWPEAGHVILTPSEELTFVDLSTGRVRRLAAPGQDYVSGVAAAPDGRRFAALWHGPVEGSTIDMRSFPALRRIWTHDASGYPDPYFEGSQLRAVSVSADKPELHAFDARGRPHRIGPARAGCDITPEVRSPDGTLVATVIDGRLVVGPAATTACGSQLPYQPD